MPVRSNLRYILLIVISLGLSFAWAQNDDAGSTGFNSLKIVHGARALAMGQALTGEAKNPDGLFFNPAAIIELPNREVGSTYCNYFLDTQGGQIRVLLPKDKFGAWAFGLQYMNMGSFERTEVDQFGNFIDDLGTFGAYNLIATASMAKFISNAIDAGGSVKVVYDVLDEHSAAAVLLDLGIIHHPHNEKVKVGISLRNLGLQLKYYTDSKYKEKLPFTFAAGGSYTFTDKHESVFEINKANGENFNVRLGHEYKITPDFALRAGFKSNAGDWNSGGTFGWTSGLSLGAGWKFRSYKIDYAASSYGDLGLVNQITLSYCF